MILVFAPLAQQEYVDAFEYYEAQEAGLGERFRRALWSAVQILVQAPDLGEEVRPEIRSGGPIAYPKAFVSHSPIYRRFFGA